MFKTTLSKCLLTTLAALMLTSCALFESSTGASITANIRPGQTHGEVAAVMRTKPTYRRFFEDGIEEYEYHRNHRVNGDYDVILIRYRNGRVVSMDAYRYIEPKTPTITVEKK